MKGVAPSAFLVAASLSFAACQPRGVEGTQSLVGADRLPSSSALSREMIQINRGYGEVGQAFLSYELRPDDTLTVTRTDENRDEVLGEERFRLASDVAGRARRLLWRVRPAKFEGAGGPEARPSGCKRTGPHDFGELAVIFVAQGGGAVIDDDRIGVFELPDPHSCSTPQAAEARRLMRQVMESFPPSEVATELGSR